MKNINKISKKTIEKASAVLNNVSCTALAVLMILITLNVILRVLFKSPIPGAYDYSGFLTIMIIGCGLAYCSLENGHIEITYFVDKFNKKIQNIVTASGRMISFIFLCIYSYSLFAHAARLMKAKEVSVTTKTPVYIFIYLLAVCFTIFSFAVLLKFFESIKKGAADEC